MSPSPSSPHPSPYVKPLVMMIFVLQYSRSPLIAALLQGHLYIVNALIEAGANVNQSDKVGICVAVVVLHKCTPCSALISSLPNYGFTF